MICLSHPFHDSEPCTARAQALASGKDVAAVDILLVVRALPIATNVALVGPVSTGATTLASDPAGTPELTPAMIIAGNLAGEAGSPRYAVGGAEVGDLLFRITGNMLSGKNGDGKGGAVASGALCLFRPFNGTPAKTELYLLRRTDGHAFGSTSADWTVGVLQPVTGGMRIRYRAASHHMECASELVVPADAVSVLAQFVKVVG